jgi:tRNA U34 5-methylaminomethyl-2-thiouridine-forming methyltransferase MnmC
MKRTVIQTEDGSSSIRIDELDETYHSKHGAIQEAKHVFIEAGFYQLSDNQNSILEIGFGTGLNAFLTAIESGKTKKLINYTGIEAFPVSIEMTKELNYTKTLGNESLFADLHNSTWEEYNHIHQYFELNKTQIKLEGMTYSKEFDLIYFDAFGHRAQPEMWDINLLEKCKNALKPNGIFVTYAAKGQLKRDLKSLGFEVESIPGPPGKREMTRAHLLNI